VLREGGQLWMTLHPFKMAVMRIWKDLKMLNPRDAVYQSYAVANGFSLELFGRQFRFPVNRSQYESVQSVRGIAKALFREGFCDVHFEIQNRGDGVAADAKYGRLFVVSARKRLGDPE
jgi:hypothetical protein